jgi:hypothetical protein
MVETPAKSTRALRLTRAPYFTPEQKRNLTQSRSVPLRPDTPARIIVAHQLNLIIDDAQGVDAFVGIRTQEVCILFILSHFEFITRLP